MTADNIANKPLKTRIAASATAVALTATLMPAPALALERESGVEGNVVSAALAREAIQGVADQLIPSDLQPAAPTSAPEPVAPPSESTPDGSGSSGADDAGAAPGGSATPAPEESDDPTAAAPSGAADPGMTDSAASLPEAEPGAVGEEQPAAAEAAEGAVVKVGDVAYADIMEAIDAAPDGATVELLADVDHAGTIMLGKSVTIEGNGHTVSTTANRVVRICRPDVTVVMNDLALKGSKSVTYDGRGISFDDAASGAHLVLNGCHVSSAFYAINVAFQKTTGVVVDVNESTVQGWAAFNVYGTGGTFNVRNSMLIATNDKAQSEWNNFAMIAFGANGADAATDNTFNVSDSTLRARSASTNMQTIAWASRGATGNRVNISGASSVSYPAANQFFVNNNDDPNANAVVVTGGTYPYDVTGHCSVNVAAFPNANGTFTAGAMTDENSAARVGSGADAVYFLDAVKAIDAAPDGATVTLLADVDHAKPIMLGKSVTIEGGGHTLSTTANRIVRITKPGVSVVINDLDMKGPKNLGSDGRGISFDDAASGAHLTLSCCSVSSSHYAINVAFQKTTDVVVDVNGSTLDSWAAFNVYGTNGTFNVSQSTLLATNDKSQSEWNNFTMFSFGANGADAATSNTVNVTDSALVASTKSTNLQTIAWSSRGATNNKVNLSGSSAVSFPGEDQFIVDNNDGQSGNGIVVHGGIYSHDVAAHLADGIVLTPGPDNSFVAGVPSEPDVPETPDKPDAPETPNQPSQPSTPSQPSQPAAPSQPGASSQPSRPSAPSGSQMSWIRPGATSWQQLGNAGGAAGDGGASDASDDGFGRPDGASDSADVAEALSASQGEAIAEDSTPLSSSMRNYAAADAEGHEDAIVFDWLPAAACGLGGLLAGLVAMAFIRRDKAQKEAEAATERAGGGMSE